MKVFNWISSFFKESQVVDDFKWCGKTVDIIDGDHVGKTGRVISYSDRNGHVCIMPDKQSMFMDHEDNIIIHVEKKRWFLLNK
jgi:hypothetical protein